MKEAEANLHLVGGGRERVLEGSKSEILVRAQRHAQSTPTPEERGERQTNTSQVCSKSLINNNTVQDLRHMIEEDLE